MVDADDVAILTGRVAQAMQRARSSLDGVAQSLSGYEFDKVLQRRLEEVESFGAGVGRVQQAEYDAEQQGRIASQSQDHYVMERWNDADLQVRRSFGYAQGEAGNLASGIGAAQRQLMEYRDDLAGTAASLDQALKDVDVLERFPEYGQADELRGRLTNLRALTTSADAGLGDAFDRLENARSTAARFERAEQFEVGHGRHSEAVRDTTSRLRAGMNWTRDEVSNVRESIDAKMSDVHAMAEYGVSEATKAADLANAVRAGSNPTQRAVAKPTEHTATQSADQPAGNSAVQDQRSRRGGRDTGQER
jgi:hypothetical protein